jgi:uncharacterized protein (DUF1778 family)
MTSESDRQTELASIMLRIRRGERDLMENAARLVGKTPAQFVRDAARSAAEDVVLDQVLFEVNPKAYDAFLRLLDAAPKPNDRLRRTLRTRPVWS